MYSNGTADNQIHWFSITNSSVIVMFLTVLVAMIMIRALRKDIQRYNAEVSAPELETFQPSRTTHVTLPHVYREHVDCAWAMLEYMPM